MNKNRVVTIVLTLVATVGLDVNASRTRAVQVGEPIVYRGNTYYLLDNQSWEDAEAEAISLGGHLVAIDSAAENDFILNTFAADHIWIGLSDRDSEGQWVWANGDPMTYTNWRGGEPNDLFGEDYAHMHGSSHGDRGTWNDLDGTWLLRSVVEVPGVTAIRATVDVKPRAFPNSVNPRAKGLLPVAVLTTRIADGDALDFDAAGIDPMSIQFGPGLAVEAHGRGHLEDVDEDGDLDLVLHFDTQASGIVCGDNVVSLSGRMTDGSSFIGADSLRTVGCR